ncbi:APC family permease [Pseudomonas sp. BN414]|uniref:APC family permease n=1 Tax=Pseudomonas sp. BN414 TaxID=2567888 RepID=UPI0024579716|nr:APC family permease [Pseudomonas sp. BN414]MDH4567103.1 APC family permease [Pseudomonas sp. BN414]
MSGVQQSGLRKNAIGVAGIVFFVVAAAAPLTVVVGSVPLAITMGGGVGIPSLFLIAGLLYLLFAVGYCAMSRHIGNAGAFYTFVTRGLNPLCGAGSAFMALLAYNAVQFALYGGFGYFLSDALKSHWGIEIPWFALVAGTICVVHFCGSRDIDFSGKLLAALLIGETAIVLAIDIAIILSNGNGNGFTAAPFSPSQVLSPGLGIGLIFAICAFLGFEATAIFSEEARDPVRTIPRATYVAVSGIMLFYAFSAWAIIQAYGVEGAMEMATRDPGNLWLKICSELLGSGASALMNILVLTSMFAAILSFHNSITRYLFAMGREQLLWSGLARTHGVHRSPYIAGRVQSIAAMLCMGAFAGFGQDPYLIIYSWMAALSTIGMIAVQVLACLAVIGFFWKDARGTSLWQRLIAPAASAVCLTVFLALVIDNLTLMSGSESWVVRSFPYLVLITGIAGVACAMYLKRAHPAKYQAMGLALAGAAE